MICKLSVGTAERGKGFGKEPHRSSGVPSLALLPIGPSGDVISLSAGRETSRESFLQAQKYFLTCRLKLINTGDIKGIGVIGNDQK
jgi:hypothetical protein